MRSLDTLSPLWQESMHRRIAVLRSVATYMEKGENER
jgi:hypothetical protein